MKNYIFDLDKIVGFLKQYKDDLHKLYTWNAKIDRLVELNVLTELEFRELSKLVKEISAKLWNDENAKKMLYYTEMLLFSIADREIYMDITNKLTLEIK
jgi:hypothetical protein